jgi:hypothetical protein
VHPSPYKASTSTSGPPKQTHMRQLQGSQSAKPAHEQRN